VAAIKKTYRIDEGLAGDIAAIAGELRQSENQVIETALKLYRDYHYMQNKASFINEQILHMAQGMLRLAENSINQKTNKLLSELAVQNAIQNQVIAARLEVRQADLRKYRIAAVTALKEAQRIFRLDEAADE
jgi:hypothetical protein